VIVEIKLSILGKVRLFQRNTSPPEPNTRKFNQKIKAFFGLDCWSAKSVGVFEKIEYWK